jgi:hypothetical protein
MLPVLVDRDNHSFDASGILSNVRISGAFHELFALPTTRCALRRSIVWVCI